jgi:endonuclease III
METRELISFLKIIDVWKESVKEPVVEKVKRRLNDPFSILVATILSLRTRDQVTEKVFEKLSKKVRTVDDLLKIDEKELAGLIYSTGFYKNKVKSLKEIAKILKSRYDGKVPDDLDKLLELPGVGRKTANLVLTEGFGKYGICVDTHVHRILNWWGYVRTATPEKTEMSLRDTLPRQWWKRINGILVTFGQNVCRPVAPRCGECLLRERCPYPKKRL